MKPLILFIGLLPMFATAQSSPNDDSTIYRSAIKDAMYPEEYNVYNKLVPITKKNPNSVSYTHLRAHETQ